MLCKYSPIRRIVSVSRSVRQVTAVLLRWSVAMSFRVASPSTFETYNRDWFLRDIYVDESTSMDRHAGAPDPGAGGCRGLDFDSSGDRVHLCHLARASPPDRR